MFQGVTQKGSTSFFLLRYKQKTRQTFHQNRNPNATTQSIFCGAIFLLCEMESYSDIDIEPTLEIRVGIVSLDNQSENWSDYDTDFFGGCHDSDSIGIDEEFEAPLSWKLDPSHSLSDWLIKITRQNSKKTDEYFVHKSIMAVGPRKSEYFASLFRCSHQLAESASNTSDIELDDMTADAFPSMLDFLYSPTNTLYISTEKAIALRYLAQYFGIRLLHKKVMEFLRKDISLSTVSTYISNTNLFHDEKISGYVAETCAVNILEILPTSDLVLKVNPKFFLHVISSPEIDTCAVSGHLSVLVAAYCKIHRKQLDESTFLSLTHRNHMPFIEREAALMLLDIEADLIASMDEEGGLKVSLPKERELSCLQKRCIKVLSLHWKEVSEENRSKASTVFEKIHSAVLLELLDKSLSIVRQRLEESTKSADNQRVKLEQEFDVKLSQSTERFEREQQVLQRLQRDTMERLSQMRQQLAEKDRQLAEYRTELNCFFRVPTTYSFSDITRSTYHHLSQPEPFDHATFLCQYGRRRPTALPRLGDKNEDGYLYVTQKGGSLHERLPVYYYKDD
jgi:hypothetical protein